MKKRIFLVVAISIVAAITVAQNGTLTVSSGSNQNFWLFIDDVLQNEYSTNSIRIQGLQIITYRVRVEMDNALNNCVGQVVEISMAHNQNNYLISQDRQNNFIFGKSNVQANPFFVQNLILPDFNYFSHYQQFLYPGFNPNANYGQTQTKGNRYRGYQLQSGRGFGSNQGYSGHQPSPSSNQGHGGNQAHGGNQGYARPAPCMPAADFNKAFAVIQKETFDNSKLSTAQQVASRNNLCVSQIVQICKLFTYEKTKLDFAKYAYQFCVDKNNYFQLNEVFSFTNSKDELRKFIDGK